MSPFSLRYLTYLTGESGTLGSSAVVGTMRTQKGETMADDPPARRRRGTELEQAILRAAADELTEAGYAGLTMDRVAQRAHTNKNAIYRRWPNRAALGVAAYRR